MKKTFQLLIWLSIYLVLISASNYLINKNVYLKNFSMINLLLSNLGYLVLIYCFFNLADVFRSKMMKIISQIFLFLLLLIAFIEIIIYKYSGVAFVDQSFLHFEFEALKVGFYIYPLVIISSILLLGFFAWFLTKPLRNISIKLSFVLVGLSLILISTNFFGSSLGRLLINHNEFKNKKSVPALSIDKVKGYEKFGIKPVKYTTHGLQAKFLGKQKNVIILYLESFSHFFTTSEDYPGLTPNLKSLSSKYGQFENYHSTAGFTIEGLMSSMCGFLPQMLFGNDNLSVGVPYQALPCLSDALNLLGYQQEFIGGAKKAFSNKEAFLLKHKFDKVWGWLDFKKEKGYKRNNWGYQDDDLYDFAFDRIKSLHNKKQLFQVSILNLSTHLSGNPAPSCPKYLLGKRTHKYLDGIHCIDFLVGRLIKRLEKENILDDTIIYISSDHGVFGVDLVKDLFGKNKDHHKLFGMIIAENTDFDFSKLAGLYDLAPTILKLLNIESNIGFINGLPWNEIQKNRLLLRKQKLRLGSKSLILAPLCNADNKIDFPIDKCEKSRLLNLSYGHAESFSSEKERVNVNSLKSKVLIRSSTSKGSLSEFIVNDIKQDKHFFSHGNSIHDSIRKKRNHLFVWVYDIHSQQVIQKRAFSYNQTKNFVLKKMLNKLKGDYALIMFTDGYQPIEVPNDYIETLKSLGSKKITKNHLPYIAVYKTLNGTETFFEQISLNKSESLSIFLNGINDPKYFTPNTD